VWAADSFEGLPSPNAERYPGDAGDRHHEYSYLAVPLEEVRENFRRYGLLDEQVVFLKGWFRDTLPSAPIESLAVMRLDGDMYEATWDALANLYPKLSPGGYLIVDDYKVVPGCRQAVDEYRARHGLAEEIVEIDWAGVYCRKAG
jgi:O-methyltransferase